MRLAVCSFLERPVDGTLYKPGTLPLHVTLLGNFTLNADYDAIDDILKLAVGMLPINIRPGSDEHFGPIGEFQVTVAVPSHQLDELHHELLRESQRIGAVFDNPDFNGEGFRAHVTWLDGLKPTWTAALTLETLSIVDLEPDGNDRLRQITTTT